MTRAALASFDGVQRRFTVRGEAGGVTVVDDYGHHPAEVKATLLGAREAFRRRVVCLFQPHRYTRTRDLHDEFATAFNDADVLLLTDIYAAGEEPMPGVTPGALVEAIRGLRPQGRHLRRPRAGLAAAARARLRPGDLVLTLGAGDITAGRPRAARPAEGWGAAVADWRDEVAGPPARRGAAATSRSPRAPPSGWAARPTSWSARPIPSDLAALLRAVRDARGAAHRAGRRRQHAGGRPRACAAWCCASRPTSARSAARARTLLLPAGAPIARLMARAHALGLVGAEFIAGIPGTLGGATAMNAGTRQGELAEVLTRVELATAEGTGFVPAASLGLAYRHSELPPGAVVTRVEVRAAPRRRGRPAAPPWRPTWRGGGRTQPLTQPSFGSTFANPPGHFAGRLIEAVGLKGHRVGGAMWSDVHANFLVNLGGATAADVLALMRAGAARVAERFGVELRPEVRLLGEFAPGCRTARATS